MKRALLLVIALGAVAGLGAVAYRSPLRRAPTVIKAPRPHHLIYSEQLGQCIDEPQG